MAVFSRFFQGSGVPFQFLAPSFEPGSRCPPCMSIHYSEPIPLFYFQFCHLTVSCIFFLIGGWLLYNTVCMLRCFSPVWLFATLWTVAHQAPLFIGILLGRILERVAVPSSRGSSWLRGQTHISCFLHWQVGSIALEAPGKPTILC